MDVKRKLAKFIKSPNDMIKLLTFIQTFNGNTRLQNIYRESELSKKEFIDTVDMICIDFIDNIP